MPYNNSIFAVLINVYSNQGVNMYLLAKIIMQFWGIKNLNHCYSEKFTSKKKTIKTT